MDLQALVEVVGEVDAHCSARGEVAQFVHPELDRQAEGGAGHERDMQVSLASASADSGGRLRGRDMNREAKKGANLHDCIELPAFPVSVSIARRYVALVLERWGCEELIDDARLIGSELVTNGIKAVELSEVAREAEIEMFGILAGCDRHVWIALHRTADDVVIEVWDPSLKPPRIGHPSASEVGGRGLQVVDKTAAEWGYRWLSTGGKIVWALLKIRQQPGVLDEVR
ncbi:ATP-binding protein [Nonomuraea sp. NPDC050680]|uniref:ATP-binding protein n=1 Tax=Nonomuraea sp. NPDC050680 TaxID=3154630 RepID=UPI00340555E2